MADETLTETLQATIRAARGPVKTSMPARVVSYDEATQTATVQPIVRYVYYDYDADEESTLRFPPVTAPVAFPQGGGFSLTWPLAAGDDVVLLFCDRDIGAWRGTGGGDVEPGNRERFPRNSALVVPGIKAPAAPLESDRVDGDNIVFGAPAGVEFKFGDSTASQALALAAAVASQFNQIRTIFNAHTHPAGALVAGPTAVTGVTAIPASAFPGTDAATLGTNRIKVDE